ncbi:MAG: MoaD/ThiS family protein [Bacillota bacterium]|jgi:molybdopterin converting factor small subunit
MVKTEQMPVTVEVLGHLIYYLSGEYRDGPRARKVFRPGITVGHLPELLDIPVPEIEAIVVNGIIVTDKSTVLRSGDQVVIMPVVSEPTELPGDS